MELDRRAVLGLAGLGVIGTALSARRLVAADIPGRGEDVLTVAILGNAQDAAARADLVRAFNELHPDEFGLVNAVLAAVNLPEVGWLTTPGGAVTVVIGVYVWQNFGFTFLLFVGGLASIPRDVYEASAIDGATGWKQFRAITLPLLSPTTLVASVMAIIAALQIFDQPYVLTRGGPGDATRTAVMVIFESAFGQLEFGRASAIGIVLTLVIIGVTALQFRLSRRFVFYS